MNSTQSVIILPDEPIATIHPFLHGHFTEHLGELVYPGLCVPPDCPIPNTNGLRNDVIEALRPLQIPILRWPGGCFADSYHWRDGIGPVESRPLRVNAHWGMARETNHFGTHEFMNLCRILGAEPYFAANLGSTPPSELRDWAEYCNFAGRSTLADERRANGAHEPFNIRYWGIGNENWGCGGNMSPEAYAEEFARYRTFLFNYPNTPTDAVLCGADGPDWEWTRRVFQALATGHTRPRLRLAQSYACHYYCGTTGKSATEFSNDDYIELLARAAAVEGIITGHRALMDQFDPDRRIKLLLDEWGAWHPVEPGKPMSGLFQQNTMRDAAVAAITLDTFHNHADKLHMANIAQLINVLQALLLVEEDRCIKTPTYHVFDLYQPHKNATAVRFINASETVSDGGPSRDHCRRCHLDQRPIALKAIHGSASLSGNTLTITATNTHPTQFLDLDITIQNHTVTSATLTTLTSDDLRAHNTFDQPDRVKLSAPRPIKIVSNRIKTPLPPGSIARIQAAL